MIFTRSQLEAQEVSRLASYAVRSGQSRGRFYSEKSDLTRTSFQRDRDRVIHSKAFRRSKGKTQVFVAHYGDHYRSRMMHSMEVAQISRDMARTLGLNEDLAETIALAHDLGHTPFGHAGEATLHEMMQPYGLRFEHNEQSLRIVERLEYRYADFVGLNLTYEVRDGLIKHRTTYDNPSGRSATADSPSFGVDHPMPSLEAQLVNLADEIAYQNHDIDDGLRSGILTVKKLNGIALWKKAQEGVTMELGEEVWISMTVSALIKLMIHDVCGHSDSLLNHHSIRTLEDVYQTAAPLMAFSPEMQTMNDELKTFLHSHFYQSKGVTKYNLAGQKAIRTLFAYFMDHFEAIPLDPRADRTEPRAILVKDYVAGMTDNFALEVCRKV